MKRTTAHFWLETRFKQEINESAIVPIPIKELCSLMHNYHKDMTYIDTSIAMNGGIREDLINDMIVVGIVRVSKGETL